MEFIKPTIKEVEFDNQKYYYSSVQDFDEVIQDINPLGKAKYYGVNRCWKCHGTGSVIWQRDNGICYECNGRGKLFTTLKVSKNKETIQRRLNRQKDKEKDVANKKTAKIKEQYGNNLVIVLDTEENKTYEWREYLKSHKGRWNPFISHWYIPESEANEISKNFNIIKLGIDKIVDEESGEISWTKIKESIIEK